MVESQVQEVMRKVFDDVVSLPIDLIAIADMYNISVNFGYFEDENLLGQYKSNKKEIRVSNTLSAVEKREVIAHEIAHAILDKGKTHSFMKKVEIDQSDSEEFAHEFAIQLLLPKDSFLSYVDEGVSIDDIAKIFAVSKSLITKRLTEIDNE